MIIWVNFFPAQRGEGSRRLEWAVQVSAKLQAPTALVRACSIFSSLNTQYRGDPKFPVRITYGAYWWGGLAGAHRPEPVLPFSKATGP